MESIGRFINEKIDVFHIESTINNRMFAKPLDFLGKNETDLTPITSGHEGHDSIFEDPQPARQAIFEKVPAPYGVIAVHAGETEAVHKLITGKVFPAVGCTGEGSIRHRYLPDSIYFTVQCWSVLNPLLVSVMAEGYLYNLHRGAPLLKKGGTIIITHPCTDKFDKEQHLAYVEFFHKLLPQTRDAMKVAQTI